MNCPWCEVEAGPRALHAHLGEQHSDAVAVVGHHDKTFYEITCPRCGERYQHVVRKGARDRSFVTEFGREIAMVALDMLVHHLLAEHEHQHEEHEQRTGD